MRGMKAYFAAVAVLLVAVVLVSGCENQETPNSEVPVEKVFRTVATGSTDDGDVLIEIAPGQIRNGVLVADVSANTHSVDLSQFDLAKLSTLSYNGKILKPVSVPLLSGHHSSGEMVFDLGVAVDGKTVEGFAITIKGIPAVDERVFEWKNE